MRGTLPRALLGPPAARWMLAVLFVFVPRTAAPRPAFPEPQLQVATSGMVQAGDWVEIELDADLEDVHEFEIMVSFDGGRSYPLQITRELDPRTRRFYWQVPDVECTELRMRLRYERDGHENEAEASTALAVASRDDAPATARQIPQAVGTGESPRPARRGEPRPGGATSPGEESEGLEFHAPSRSFGAASVMPAAPLPARDAFRRPPRVSAAPLYTPPRN